MEPLGPKAIFCFDSPGFLAATKAMIRFAILMLLLFLGLLQGCKHPQPLSVMSSPPMVMNPAPGQPPPNRRAPTNTVFQTYDNKLISAIRHNWETAIQGMPHQKTGMITISWRLFPDGSITDVKLVENNSDTALGEKATTMFTNLAPFDGWPPDMRAVIARGYRDCSMMLFVP